MEQVPAFQPATFDTVILTSYSQHRPEVVEASLDACLAELELDYLDLYLVHWPVAFQKGDSYFPLIANSPVEGGDVAIDSGVSIVDTWNGALTRDFNSPQNHRS